MQEIIDKNVVKSALTKRKADDNKFSIGTLLSICGSYGMAGAGIMSGKSALRSGLGLLRMVIPDSIYEIMAGAISEAVYCPVKEGTKPEDISFIEKINNNNAVLIGCGLSVGETSVNLVKEVLKRAEVPVVLDADALNIIAKNPELLKIAKAPLVLTPHMGEMSRLLGVSVEDIKHNREDIAVSYAKKNNVVLVLKSHTTIVASPKGQVIYNRYTGNSGMATGGSGDVLAGIIASLIAQGGDPYKSASAGVYIHGLAGDIASQTLGKRSMLPTDIIDCIPKAFMSIE
jgi:NAD(P)H-hydrate epimerase